MAHAFMVRPGDGQIFYRLVRDEEDELDSWRSRYELRIPPPLSAKGNAALYMGLSVWESLELAEEAEQERRIAGRTPFDAAVEVQARQKRGIVYARTGETRGHFTLWGTPKNLRACNGKSHPV